MLGLRAVRNAGNDNIGANRAILGSAELNAYGRTWYNVPQRGGAHANAAAFAANIDPNANNFWQLRNRYQNGAAFLADRDYAYGA